MQTDNTPAENKGIYNHLVAKRQLLTHDAHTYKPDYIRALASSPGFGSPAIRQASLGL